MSNSPKPLAEQLLVELSDRTINTQTVENFLESHSRCFEGDMCEVCEFIDNEGLDDPLGILAENPSLAADQQSRVMNESFKWQGRQYAVAIGFVLNPNICDDLVKFIVDSPSWFWLEGTHRLLPDVFQAMKQNPKFGSHDIARFRDSAAEAGFDLN